MPWVPPGPHHQRPSKVLAVHLLAPLNVQVQMPQLQELVVIVPARLLRALAVTEHGRMKQLQEPVVTMVEVARGAARPPSFQLQELVMTEHSLC